MKAITKAGVRDLTNEMRNFGGFPEKDRAVKSGRSTASHKLLMQETLAQQAQKQNQ